MTKHHRKPKSLGGTLDPRNVSRVSQKKHRAYHLLFANGTPYQIAEQLNRIWIDPDYEFIVQRRVAK